MYVQSGRREGESSGVGVEISGVVYSWICEYMNMIPEKRKGGLVDDWVR